MMISKKLLVLFSAAMLAAYACTSREGCPEKKDAEDAIKKVLRVGFEVADMKDSDVPGLCEVVINVGKDRAVFYMDKKARYVINGSITEVSSKKNLTQEALKKYNVKK